MCHYIGRQTALYEGRLTYLRPQGRPVLRMAVELARDRCPHVVGIGPACCQEGITNTITRVEIPDPDQLVGVDRAGTFALLLPRNESNRRKHHDGGCRRTAQPTMSSVRGISLQRIEQRTHVGKPIGRMRTESTPHGAVDPSRDRTVVRSSIDPPAQLGGCELLDRLSLERGSTAQTLEQARAETELIRARVRGLQAMLLGGHVCRRSHQRTRLCQAHIHR